MLLLNQLMRFRTQKNISMCLGITTFYLIRMQYPIFSNWSPVIIPPGKGGTRRRLFPLQKINCARCIWGEDMLSYGIDLVPIYILFLNINCIYTIHRYQPYYDYGATWKYSNEYIRINYIQLLLNLWHSELIRCICCWIYGTLFLSQ